MEKDTVSVERIRPETDTATDDVTVIEEVRQEKVDADVGEDLPKR